MGVGLCQQMLGLVVLAGGALREIQRSDVTAKWLKGASTLLPHPDPLPPEVGDASLLDGPFENLKARFFS